MNEERDPFKLDLELPEGRDFVSLPPKLSLEEYEVWCEEYWISHGGPKKEKLGRTFEEFTM